MSRTERLLDLIAYLRTRRSPVSGQDLAQEMGISIRTLYRDIATLQAQGADIRGEPGLGYVLNDGFLLPALMFSPDEIEALVIGSRWLAKRSADPRLGQAAELALAKIAAVLPAHLRPVLEDSTFLIAPGEAAGEDLDLTPIRAAIRKEHKIAITYRKDDGEASRRVLWPFLIGFFDRVQILVAWCEMRGAYRHFRLDRITGVEPMEERYPRRRHAMVKEWRAQHIPTTAGN